MEVGLDQLRTGLRPGSNRFALSTCRESSNLLADRLEAKFHYVILVADELCALFIPLQHLCPIGWHFIMLTFRLFPRDVTNCVVISLRNCATHPVASTTCCHQPVTRTSPSSRLRRASIYPRPYNRTNRYKSFIHHALLNYQ